MRLCRGLPAISKPTGFRERVAEMYTSIPIGFCTTNVSLCAMPPDRAIRPLNTLQPCDGKYRLALASYSPRPVQENFVPALNGTVALSLWAGQPKWAREAPIVMQPPRCPAQIDTYLNCQPLLEGTPAHQRLGSALALPCSQRQTGPSRLGDINIRYSLGDSNTFQDLRKGEGFFRVLRGSRERALYPKTLLETTHYRREY